MKYLIVAMSFALASTPAFAADSLQSAPAVSLLVQPGQPAPLPIFKGRVAVIDGRTLWFPAYAQRALPSCLSLAFPVSIWHEITQLLSPVEGVSFSA